MRLTGKVTPKVERDWSDSMTQFREHEVCHFLLPVVDRCEQLLGGSFA